VTTGADRSAVKLGPGLLYIAPLGTTEPTSLTGALAAGFVALGYTEEGHQTTVETARERIYVAELLDPIRNVKTGRITTVEAQLAQITARNLQIAQNGGTIGSPTGGYVTFTPPAMTDADVGVMLVWQADDNQERWLFRECYAQGAIAIPRRKSPTKSVIPVTFDCIAPSSGLQPFAVWFASAMSGV
jgi:hypothetical protein